jgi:hypothetical protein
MQLDESLGLPAILRAEAAPAEHEHHRIWALQLRELPPLPGVVGQLVVREHGAWDDVGSHVTFSLAGGIAVKRPLAVKKVAARAAGNRVNAEPRKLRQPRRSA